MSVDEGKPIPTAATFLQIYLAAAKAEKQQPQYNVEILSRYIIDVCLSSYHLLKFRPSQLAAAAVLIAQRNAKLERPWSANLVHHTKLKVEDLIPVAEAILSAKTHMSKIQLVDAVNEKYSRSEYDHLANLELKMDFPTK